ncbi:hypothetical protein F4778DRAFT_798317 [Xylariomycetidae sp. FL2044]|nr:hypothetical protein F4778DRAFT_798317 [Xylariomycetidae sp. FL2044]
MRQQLQDSLRKFILGLLCPQLPPEQTQLAPPFLEQEKQHQFKSSSSLTRVSYRIRSVGIMEGRSNLDISDPRSFFNRVKQGSGKDTSGETDQTVEVPIENVSVPRYTEKVEYQADHPKAKAWIVYSKTQEDKSFKLWMKPEMHEKLQKIYPELPEAEVLFQGGGFRKGLAMVEESVTIPTFGGLRRPEILYRVVHDGQPHDGIKARGYGLVDIIPLHFQMLVMKHLRWRCRDPSPFLSVTDDRDKVCNICQIYDAKGMSGITIYKFRSSGQGWDHKRNRLWHIGDLYRSLKCELFSIPYLKNDYLLEQYIPPESIIGRLKWDDIKVHGSSYSREKGRQAAAENRKREREALETFGRADDDSNQTEQEGPPPKRLRATDFKLRI